MAGSSSLCEPLTDPHTQIRLLSIPNNDLQSLKLETFDAGSWPDYAALSYCWGTSLNTQPIVLGSRRVYIRQNLHNFLSAICYHKDKSEAVEKSRADQNPALFAEARLLEELLLHEYFWVDALCIDQSNVAERGAQVSIMNRIFAGAKEVLVYLGGVEIDPCLQHLRSTFYGLQKIKDGQFEWPDSIPWKPSHDVIDLMRPFWRSLYWTRLWIVQEYALARRILFVSPIELVSPQSFASSLGCGSGWTFSPCGLVPGPAAGVIRNNYDISNGRGEFLKMWPPSHLGSLLLRFGKSKCTDPRDKVYALLGLLDVVNYKKRPLHGKDAPSSSELERQSTPSFIMADYSISPAELRKRLLQYAKAEHDGVADTWLEGELDRLGWNEQWAQNVPDRMAGFKIDVSGDLAREMAP